MDAGDRATQDAKAEGARRAGEGIVVNAEPSPPAPLPQAGEGS